MKRIVVLLALVSAGAWAAVQVAPAMLGMFKPLPAVVENPANAITDAKVDLGRMLYYEKRLSKNQDVSCNTCHLLDKYGVDGLATSTGHRNQKGGRNAPTVYNAALHIAQFWDGRAADVEAQAKGPVMNPIEMAMPDEKQVLTVLKSIPGYVDAFAKAFPGEQDAVSYDNMAKAIGAFERKLVTPSRFDKFLTGDQSALTDAEKDGFNQFVQTGCTVCHNGTDVGGAMYQKLGLVKAWPDASDPGRAKITNNDADKMVFKVPSLRNIAKTGPYFHNGSIATLEDAVTKMGEHQLGRTLSAEDVKKIVTFLNSLTGEIPQDYVKEPALPPSGPTTPKADPT